MTESMARPFLTVGQQDRKLKIQAPTLKGVTMGNSSPDGTLLLKPGTQLLEDHFSLTGSEKKMLDAAFAFLISDNR